MRPRDACAIRITTRHHGAMTDPADCEWAAFTEHAPWVVDRDQTTWLQGAARLRASCERGGAATSPDRRGSRQVASRHRRRPAHRGARSVAVASASPAVPSVEASRSDISRRLRLAAERLGPTYIKLGQIISRGEGLFPPELVDEFKMCRDQVPAESFDDVRRTVEEDLGARLEDVFASFDRTPLAAASIAQVHAARLRTGEDVVVKVQRPAVDRLVRHDLRVMAWLAPHLVGRIPIAALANPPALVELFAETIVEELDFRMEAANMLDIATRAARPRPGRLRRAPPASRNSSRAGCS